MRGGDLGGSLHFSAGVQGSRSSGGMMRPCSTLLSRHIKTKYDQALESEKIAYRSIVSAFKRYLYDRDWWQLEIKGKNIETGETITIKKNDVHRWTDAYFNKRLARLYKLRDWYKEHPDLPCNMWTFTVPHNENKWHRKVRTGADQFQAWENLKQGWDRLRQCPVMRDREFVLFYEPHPETGYPHIHTMNFDDFTQEEQNHIKRLWHEFTGADLEHGTDYQPGKGVNHIIAYLVKYMAKTFYHSRESWNYGEWIFNAIAHQKKYRLFSSSQNLSKVMRLDTYQEGKFQCDQVLMAGNRDTESDQTYKTKLWSLPGIPADLPVSRPFRHRLEEWKFKNNNNLLGDQERAFQKKHTAWIEKGRIERYKEDRCNTWINEYEQDFGQGSHKQQLEAIAQCL